MTALIVCGLVLAIAGVMWAMLDDVLELLAFWRSHVSPYDQEEGRG